MNKLKLLSTAMVILGFVSFIAGISINIKELMEFGLCIGVAGIIGYAIMFLISSTSIRDQESIID